MYDGNDTSGMFMLNNSTGLTNSPTMERRDDDWTKDDDDDGQGRYQYSAESILNYRVTTGDQVKLQSEFIDIVGTVLSGEHSFDGTNPLTTLELGVK